VQYPRKGRRPYHHGNLRRALLDNPSHYRVMFGGFVNTTPRSPELSEEATGAFQALVDALASLQRDKSVRGDDTLLMARYVWAVVHGVAMLAIDGQFCEPGGVERLMQYASERLQNGIAAHASADGHPFA
jgi:WHG domain-containing protein